MMATKYYKTDSKKITNELSKMNSDKDAFILKINNIAKHFNSRALTSTSVTGVRFGGLELKNYHSYSWEEKQPIREDKILWTQPNENNISRPRASLTKKHFESYIREMSDDEAKLFMKETRGKLKLLQDEYSKMTCGVNGVSFDSFFESIGTDWGNLMFSGMKWFEFNGFVYFSSGCDLSENLTEILGSEFEKAQIDSKK